MIYRYARAYGTRMSAILNDATALENLGVHYGQDVYEAEILYLIQYEFVHTLDDVLWRRSKLGLHVTQETLDNLEAAFPNIMEKANTQKNRYINAAA